MSKLTAGPWEYNFYTYERGHTREWYEISSKNRKVGEVSSFMISDEDKANAHLIAAAPDMYEALRLFVQAEKLGDWEQSNYVEKAAMIEARAKARAF